MKFTLKEINRAQLNRRTNSLIVDVREPYEREDGSIPNSINIPMGDMLENLDKLKTDKDIILYCKTGRRAAAVSMMLRRLHKIKTYNLEGGYEAYQNKPDFPDFENAPFAD